MGQHKHNSSKILIKNQDDYLSKIKKIHHLLSPHAHLVVAYSNHTNTSSDDLVHEKNTTSSSSQSDLATTSSTINTTSSTTTKELKPITTTKSTKNNFCDDDDNNSNKSNTTTQIRNMYAARIERRLALERRDVIKLFLDNEKNDSTSSIIIVDNNKRKVETHILNDNDDTSS